MTWRLIDRDPYSGIVTWWRWDALENKAEWKRVQDVEPSLEFAKSLAKDEQYSKDGIKSEMWHYAHIPNMVLEQWHTMGVDINEPKELTRMVNKPEWSYLKTTAGQHQ